VRWTLAAIALALGALSPFAGSPYRQREVAAIELATWIKDRKPGLRIVDLRSQKEFDAFHVPTSKRLALESVTPRPGETIVVCGAADPGGADLARLKSAAEVGGATLYVLHGDVQAWISEVVKRPTAIGRYFGGMRRGGC